VIGTIRKAGTKPANPETYQLNVGVLPMQDTNKYTKLVRSYPVPASPPEAGSVEPGKVTLSIKPLSAPDHPGAKFVFEIEDEKGAKETSDPRETQWQPAMEIRAGGRYRWQVWAVDGEWKGPVSKMEFAGKSG